MLSDTVLSARPELSAIEDLEARLRAVCERAAKAFPDLPLEGPDFVAHLVRVSADQADFVTWLNDAAVEDLCLAAACAAKDARALSAFERLYFSTIRPTLEKTGQLAVLSEDFLQSLRERLFVPREERPPRIATYRGRGSLAGWFKMSLLRLATDTLQRSAPDESPLTERFLSHAATPELEMLKARYRQELKPLFAAAMDSLEPSQRVLLRQVFLDGLGGEQLSELYQVHRTTMTRRLAAACDLLRKRLRALVRAQLRGEEVVSSVLRLVESQLSLSLERLLRA